MSKSSEPSSSESVFAQSRLRQVRQTPDTHMGASSHQELRPRKQEKEEEAIERAYVRQVSLFLTKYSAHMSY